MGDQIRRALEDWVRGECAHRPVVVVFEDLHWGDLPSVKGVDVILRALANRPLFVLALARPEIKELFPDLWSERALVHDHRTQTIPWSEISAAAYVPAPLGRSALVVRLGKRRSVTITFGPETEEYGDLPSALVAFLGPRFVAG